MRSQYLYFVRYNIPEVSVHFCLESYFYHLK